ncbi:hypothetical protein PC110_g14269 [Phytophthora cactorum]|uniref:Uncharacterized protein n=1 Tax=Phytophthora cactorum TaxID=29920 RepID=A0A329S1H0_9STRA|nr:hypothetical protein PC110_g14269 [Phytophthora cactorum]
MALMLLTTLSPNALQTHQITITCALEQNGIWSSTYVLLSITNTPLKDLYFISGVFFFFAVTECPLPKL